jgi:lysophospholipase L1-like esterase
MRLGSMALAGLLVICVFSVQAQSSRLLIVGDSWAAEQWGDGSHVRVFGLHGLEHIQIYGDGTTESGSTAAEWKQASYLQRIDDALATYPDIDTVQLTIGGNDFLADWNTGLSEQQVENLKQWILFDLQLVVDHVLGLDPDIEIVLSFYDYPNFEDTRDGLIWTFACSGLWDDLGQPNPLQLNTAAVEFIGAFEQLAGSDSRVHFVDHFGLLQNRLGFPADGIGPGDLEMPGDLNRPSPLEAMRTRFFGGGHDCFHLNATGYDFLVENLINEYYGDRFARAADIVIGDLLFVYDGQPREPVITTDPPNLNLIVTFDGQSAPPVDAGSYELVVVVDQAGWTGQADATLVIEPAAQSITFEIDPASVSTQSDPITLEAEADSGLPVTLALLSGPASLDGTTLTLNGDQGVVVIEASQPGDQNWTAAESVQRSLEVVATVDELFEDRFEQ